MNDQVTGDQGTVNKIYGKLGKKSLIGARNGDTSLSVDSNKTDKAALATVPLIAARGLLKGGKAPQTALSSGERASLPGGKNIPEGSAMEKNVTGTARKALKPAQKALPKPKGEAPKMQHAKVRAGSARSQQSTSRNAGTNPRAVRSGKMKAAQKAGKPTESKDLLRTLKESVRQAKAKKAAS